MIKFYNKICKFLESHKLEVFLFLTFLIAVIIIEFYNYGTLYVEYPDAGLYISYGKNFLNGLGYVGENVSPQMVVPPGMPVYLLIIQMIFQSIIPAIILQYILHAFAALLMYKIAFKLSDNKYTSLIAPILFLICKDIHFFSPLSLLTETPTLFLLLFNLYMMSSSYTNIKKPILICLTITASGLIRPQFFIMFLPYVFYCLIGNKTNSLKRKGLILIITLFIPLGFTLLNMGFNYANTGHPVLLANYTAKPFYLANNPKTKTSPYASEISSEFAEEFYNSLDLDNPDIKDYNEKQALLKERATNYILQNPKQTLKNMYEKYRIMFIHPYKFYFMASIFGFLIVILLRVKQPYTNFLLFNMIFVYATYAIITSSGLNVQRYAIYALPIYFLFMTSGIGTLAKIINNKLHIYEKKHIEK